MSICTSCQKGTLESIIRPKPIMIIKEQVTENEVSQDGLFTLAGKNKYGNSEHTASYYLMHELTMQDLQMGTFCLSALFLHVPPKRKRSKEEKKIIQGCVDFSVTEAIKTMQDMKIILMMGAEIVRTFIGYGVSDVTGLVCKSDLLPNVPVIIPAPNPDKLMQMPIGELRNAIRAFAEQIKIYNEYRSI